MWHRVWGPASCLALLSFACGKSERTPNDNLDSGGSTAGGLARAGADTGGGTGGGAPLSAGGQGLTSSGGTATGGAVSGLGGEGSEPAEAGAPAAGAASDCEYYQACGCGCCGGQTPQAKCVYPDLGQDLNSIIADDVARRQDLTGCANVGCSVGQAYFCCEAPPPSNDGASYETSVFIGGYDRIRLHKQGAVDCSTFTLIDPKVVNPDFPVETPGNWGVEQITRLPCSSSMIGPRAIGALGTFSLRVSGDACVVDAHLTAFFGDAVQGVEAERFDAEGVPVDVPLGSCK